MSDRMDDVLASIDDVLTACICGQPIPTDGPSLDYCSPGCQYRTMADRVGAYPDPDQWDEPMPPRQPGALLEMRLGNLRVSAERPAQWLWVPSIADPAAPTRAELDGGVELRNYHNPVSFDFTVTEANREAVDVFFDDADDPRRAIRDNLDRLQQDLADRLGCPVGQLRLLTEYIGRRMATEDMTPQQAEERMLQLVQACNQPTVPVTYFGQQHDRPDEPSTPEEFRRRALEHQQNRGTGPEPRRQRLPRDHRR